MTTRAIAVLLLVVPPRPSSVPLDRLADDEVFDLGFMALTMAETYIKKMSVLS